MDWRYVVCQWQAFVLAVLRFIVIITAEKNEMGKAFSAYGGEERRFGGKT
jgi:drug/metabolite transporter superfamily protein YnfA